MFFSRKLTVSKHISLIAVLFELFISLRWFLYPNEPLIWLDLTRLRESIWNFTTQAVPGLLKAISVSKIQSCFLNVSLFFVPKNILFIGFDLSDFFLTFFQFFILSCWPAFSAFQLWIGEKSFVNVRVVHAINFSYHVTHCFT